MDDDSEPAGLDYDESDPLDEDSEDGDDDDLDDLDSEEDEESSGGKKSKSKSSKKLNTVLLRYDRVCNLNNEIRLEFSEVFQII